MYYKIDDLRTIGIKEKPKKSLFYIEIIKILYLFGIFLEIEE